MHSMRGPGYGKVLSATFNGPEMYPTYFSRGAWFSASIENELDFNVIWGSPGTI